MQFEDSDKEKKKISIQVIRNGYRQKVPIYDLVLGDPVHLSIGDQVPADGLFVSGFSLLINESILTGESEPVNVNKEKPLFLSRAQFQEDLQGVVKWLISPSFQQLVPDSLQQFEDCWQGIYEVAVGNPYSKEEAIKWLN